MTKKKGIIEEALMDIEAIQEALMNNTKEILRSTMREEIDSVVNETLKEADYEEEDIDDDVNTVNTEEPTTDDETPVDDETSDEEGTEDLESTDNDEDIESDIDTTVDDAESDIDTTVDDIENDVDDIESDMGGEDMTTLDLTNASDEEVITVFKKMSGDDEIEVISDKEVKITDPDSGNEYIVNLGGETPEDLDTEIEMGDDNFESEIDTDVNLEETVYRIELDEDIVRGPGHDEKNGNKEVKPTTAPNTGDIEGQKAEKSDVITGDNLTGGFPEDEATQGDGHAEHVMNESDDETQEDEELIVDEPEDEKDELEEQIPVGNAQARRQPGRNTNIKGAGAKQPTQWSPEIQETVKKYNTVLREAKRLKSENENFKVALKKFRQTLTETVVYNQNLTYVTKLFMEHSTTQQEKEDIMRRFDEEVTTLAESKALYKKIKSELSNKKPITESIDKKINNSIKTSSTGKLNESTVYADPSTKRILDLIERVENKNE